MDPNQLVSEKPDNLDLHCFNTDVHDISRLSMDRVKCGYIFTLYANLVIPKD